MRRGAVVEEGFVCTEETHLTVLKTSLFFAGDGFTAYDSKGTIVFRVDSYSDDASEVVLMNAVGRCILTVRRKRPSLHQRWEGFVGEGRALKPLFSVRRSSMIGRSGMTVDVYSNRPDDKKEEEYLIKGSFADRKCTIFNSKKELVAEISRKVDSCVNVVLGKEVFLLSVKSGFDSAFAMGMTLILDQIRWSDFERDGAESD